jgi:GAF domain-containing protein
LLGFAEILEASASGGSVSSEISVRSESAIGALAFIPIRREDISIRMGLLMLYENVHAFTKAERQLHQLLTDLAGPSFHRSRLVADAQSRVDREALVAAVGERLWGSLDIETILRTAVAEIGRALNADVAEIEIAPELGEKGAAVSDAAGERMRSGDGSVEPNGADTGDGLQE